VRSPFSLVGKGCTMRWTNGRTVALAWFAASLTAQGMACFVSYSDDYPTCSCSGVGGGPPGMTEGRGDGGNDGEAEGGKDAKTEDGHDAKAESDSDGAPDAGDD
jgi:hypothetical protein